MRKTDLSPERQQLLVPLDSHPGALALVPPPTPKHLQLPGLRGEIASAHEALGRLQASVASLPNRNPATPISPSTYKRASHRDWPFVVLCSGYVAAA
jgi:hypothetical protein